ncbi:MAG: VOC family protein [Acidobacteriota bacterium]
MSNNVVHFAIHADDVERARRFYEAIFGWRFEAWGPTGFYNVDTGSEGHPGIHGALHARAEPLSGTGMRGFTCTVAVDDLDEIRERVLANEGSVHHDEMVIPTVGRHIEVLDTEGNAFAAMVYERPMFGA